MYASPELPQNLEARELWKSQGKDEGRETSEVGGKPREKHFSKRNFSRFFRQIWHKNKEQRESWVLWPTRSTGAITTYRNKETRGSHLHSSLGILYLTPCWQKVVRGSDSAWTLVEASKHSVPSALGGHSLIILVLPNSFLSNDECPCRCFCEEVGLSVLANL